MKNLFDRYHKFLIFFIGLSIVIFFDVTDKYISHHPSLIIFYVIPVSLVTWFSGALAGTLIALCSVIAWFPKNILIIMDLYSHPVFFYLNMLARGSFLFITVYVFQRLKIAIEHEKELNKLKSAFVANVSHEIKNPLAVIKEALSLVLDGVYGETGGAQKNVLEIGKKNIERLIRLVTDLLDIAKIESGKMELRKEKIDMALLVDEILKDYEAEAIRKGLALKKYIQQGMSPVFADKDKISEVIINLLVNAIKYTPNGSISVELKEVAGEVHFEVADTGPGISEEYFEKIFDKFERITTERVDGTGLGLPIAKSIIELHKGKIWVESVAGKGSKFIFTLPRNSE